MSSKWIYCAVFFGHRRVRSLKVVHAESQIFAASMGAQTRHQITVRDLSFVRFVCIVNNYCGSMMGKLFTKQPSEKCASLSFYWRFMTYLDALLRFSYRVSPPHVLHQPFLGISPCSQTKFRRTWLGYSIYRPRYIMCPLIHVWGTQRYIISMVNSFHKHYPGGSRLHAM